MGAINVKHTGSGSDIALSSDGTSLLLDGTAIGGGGGSPDLYAENYDGTSTKPVATGTNSVAIGKEADSAGTDSISLGRLCSSPNSFSISLGYNSNASGFNGAMALGNSATAAGNNATAVGRNTSAGSNYSTAIGQNSGNGASTTLTGAGATALGGSRAAGEDSFAAAIANNSASYGATSANSISIGGYNKSSGTSSTCIGGYNSISSGNSSFVTGYQSQASGDFSVATGYKATSVIYGKVSHSSGPFGISSGHQTGTFVLRSDTTDDTPEAMTTSNTSAGTTNQVILPNNSAYTFTGTVVARQQASEGTDCAGFKVEGLIRREGSASTTVLLASNADEIDNVAGWFLSLSADTTNGGLKVEVTGASATNIRWVATINTSEVTY